jgi:hypothetical protein
MKYIEHYHQTLTNIKEWYWKDVEAFAKAPQLDLINMQLTCILGSFWATQLEVELVCV